MANTSTTESYPWTQDLSLPPVDTFQVGAVHCSVIRLKDNSWSGRVDVPAEYTNCIVGICVPGHISGGGNTHLTFVANRGIYMAPTDIKYNMDPGFFKYATFEMVKGWVVQLANRIEEKASRTMITM